MYKRQVARIIESMGVGTCGGYGTTAALALLNDAVKKGGVMASSSVGGLSGAFIPVSEDEGMIAAVNAGVLRLEKLEMCIRDRIKAADHIISAFHSIFY